MTKKVTKGPEQEPGPASRTLLKLPPTPPPRVLLPPPPHPSLSSVLRRAVRAGLGRDCGGGAVAVKKEDGENKGHAAPSPHLKPVCV